LPQLAHRELDDPTAVGRNLLALRRRRAAHRAPIATSGDAIATPITVRRVAEVMPEGCLVGSGGLTQ
jgi:hypothetical protein